LYKVGTQVRFATAPSILLPFYREVLPQASESSFLWSGISEGERCSFYKRATDRYTEVQLRAPQINFYVTSTNGEMTSGKNAGGVWHLGYDDE
jgi:hypothetical protein